MDLNYRFRVCIIGYLLSACIFAQSCILFCLEEAMLLWLLVIPLHGFSGIFCSLGLYFFALTLNFYFRCIFKLKLSLIDIDLMILVVILRSHILACHLIGRIFAQSFIFLIWRKSCFLILAEIFFTSYFSKFLSFKKKLYRVLILLLNGDDLNSLGRFLCSGEATDCFYRILESCFTFIKICIYGLYKSQFSHKFLHVFFFLFISSNICFPSYIGFLT